MTKHIWEGVRGPKEEWVPIDEFPDEKETALNPEQRIVLMDLYQKGLLSEEERELAEECLGIMTDDAPKDVKDEKPVDVEDVPIQEDPEPKTFESPEMEDYEDGLSASGREDLLKVKGWFVKARSRRGDNKRDWKSSASPHGRSTIRKPSEDGDAQLRDNPYDR